MKKTMTTAAPAISAHATDWSDHPIIFVAPFAAGSGSRAKFTNFATTERNQRS